MRTDNKLNRHVLSMLGNQTQATLVGGECSHHCTIPGPPLSQSVSHPLVCQAYTSHVLWLSVIQFVSPFVQGIWLFVCPIQSVD